MIDQGVTAALAARDALRSTNGDDSHNSGTSVRRTERATRECTYTDFLKCQPLPFKGTEGVASLSQWCERMECVFHISNCAVENQVKFATCTLHEDQMKIKDKLDLDQNGTPVDATKYRSTISALIFECFGGIWCCLQVCFGRCVISSVDYVFRVKEDFLDQNRTPVDATKYRSMIGALMYLTSSRPDIVHATCLCARYQAKPIKKHLKEVKRIFCYLRGTINRVFGTRRILVLNSPDFQMLIMRDVKIPSRVLLVELNS
uniref:Uncharacterized mitochondrial protein AtMg00810-like n=2 Tax=Tanacetum cinerariifolium TaxID=118510 RepID=A0A6L2JGQ6_TANCI|nr:uncharacterized mitochondrial protein AtMg00810-like [Tanacetum cinerariifolium]